MIPLRKFPFDKRVMVVAHRGDSGHAPENTLAAFRLAIASGADMVELDVQCTRDRRLVVFHDGTLGRTTNGTGYISRKDYAAICRLDAGSWFAEQYLGERIPTLEETLALLAKKMYVNIEIKPVAARKDLVSLLIAAIRKHAMEQYVLISSFHHGVLKRIKDSAPDLATAIIQKPGVIIRRPVTSARRVHADAIVCAVRQLSRVRCDDARDNGMPVCCYTVNTRRALTTALRCGASAVVTNFPSEIITMMKRV